MDEPSARGFLEERGYRVISPEQYLSDMEEPFFTNLEKDRTLLR